MMNEQKRVMSTERRAAAAPGGNMEIRNFLRDVRSKYRYAQMLSVRAERYREMAMRATGRTDAVRLSGTSHRSKVEDNVIAMMDVQREIEEKIKELMVETKRAQKLISRLENSKHRMVLEMRYLQGMTWEEIAEQMDYTLRWVHQLHKQALESF